jgi:hypothetical protein
MAVLEPLISCNSLIAGMKTQRIEIAERAADLLAIIVVISAHGIVLCSKVGRLES